MNLRRRRQPKRSRQAQERRKARVEQQRDEWFDFVDRVRNATAHGHGDCVGTPWCPVSGPHRGYTAHHVHQRSLGGTNATSNGVWICKPGHDAIDNHIAEAYELGLLASTSDPWPQETQP